jgi:hypothetical protein
MEKRIKTEIQQAGKRLRAHRGIENFRKVVWVRILVELFGSVTPFFFPKKLIA